jgi:hypothetical protein
VPALPAAAAPAAAGSHLATVGQAAVGQADAVGQAAAPPAAVDQAALVAPGSSAVRSARTGLAAGLCSVAEWQADFHGCVDRLQDLSAQRTQCLKAPTPDSPSSGLGGWFGSRPDSSRHSGVAGLYSDYGYAGYAYTTYDIGCLTVMHPDYKFENTVANGELMLATGVIGASNAVRERAWQPSMMWGWADPLVEKATRSVYRQVFTVFGALTLAIVGVYLLWRARQANMSNAMTTAGWALLVMVTVTAIASWPVFSAHLADTTLVTSLGVVHDAVGPPAEDAPPGTCKLPNPDACLDHRAPAVRASDTAVETMLYRNWLRGLLGSADSLTARKYGQALYDARSLTWDQAEGIARNPSTRDAIFQQKSDQWMKVAEQIKTEDPEAYEYLTGTKGMERIGSGLIALLASLLYAMFDLVASLLVLLGFLIFRWAVIAAPILGTVALLRPASAGFRRLVNAVVAALFNIVIFGTGAAIYLYAVDLIMSTPSLPGWLQVVLVGLCGVVGWMLLRPYRRITELGGRASGAAGLRRLLARDAGQAAAGAVALERAAGPRSTGAEAPGRPELRPEAPGTATPSPMGTPAPPRRRLPAPAGSGWSEPELSPEPAAYTLYRPSRSTVTAAARVAGVPMPEPARLRAEARCDT